MYFSNIKGYINPKLAIEPIWLIELEWNYIGFSQLFNELGKGDSSLKTLWIIIFIEIKTKEYDDYNLSIKYVKLCLP